MQPIQSVKGMADRLGDEAIRWHALVRRCADTLIRAGYTPLDTPFVEPIELYSHSLGETTEVVQKQMYRVHDPKERGYVLRPEGTASAVRAFIQAGLDKQERAHRFYYVGPMFRYERPQKGRLRQFHQVGAEVLGIADVSADAEMLVVASEMLSALGVTGAHLHINTLGGADTRRAYHDKLLGFLKSVASQLPEDIVARMDANPLRVLDSKDPDVKRVTAEAPAVADSLTDADRRSWDELRELLEGLRLPYQYDPRLVRGLDYYNGMVFEFLSDNLGAQNAVLAGGRYDGLVATLGGKSTPAVGFAAGLERLAELVQGLESATAESAPQICLISISPAERGMALNLYSHLLRLGVRVRLEADDRSVKSKMRAADREASQTVLVIGEQERTAGRGKLKFLADKVEREVALSANAIVEALGVERG